MNAPIQKPVVTLADYKAAEERLRQTQAEATAAFNKAQEAGDLAKGKELIAQQREALDAFKAFRLGIPAEVLLSINADRILESFSVDTENFVNLVIPPDISDKDAMLVLYQRFRELFPYYVPTELNEDFLDDILNAGDGSGRRARGPRVIKLICVVPGTINRKRPQQAKVLQQKGLKFSHPIEQALAAAAFACKNEGANLFKGLNVRGSVPGFALDGLVRSYIGGYRKTYFRDSNRDNVAASGSPSPELKRL